MKVINLIIRQFVNLKILTQILLSISGYRLPALNFRLLSLSFCHSFCQDQLLPKVKNAKFAKFQAGRFMAQRLNREARVKI